MINYTRIVSYRTGEMRRWQSVAPDSTSLYDWSDFGRPECCDQNEEKEKMEGFYEAYLERMETLHQHIEKAIEGLPQEALDWVPGPEMNSLAVLIIHVTGSERYWVGDVAMGEPSGRVREAEFQVRGLDEAALKGRLHESFAYVRNALSRLNGSDLDLERLAPPSGRMVQDNEPVTVIWSLLHALEHLGVHLGHIQMARQLWDQKNGAGRSVTPSLF